MTAPGATPAREALDHFLETLYATRPVDATFIGHHARDHQLPDWSPAGHDAAVARWGMTRDTLRRALGGASDDAVLASGDIGRVDLALAVAHCDLTLDELAGPQFTRGNPSLAIGEAAFSLIGLVVRDFLPAPQRASWLLQRLALVPRFLAGALATLRETPVPRAWREKALREAEGAARFLSDGIPAWCAHEGFDASRTGALRDAAELALGGVHGFTSALEALPAAIEEARACGEAHLARCLDRGHWVRQPLAELLREVRERFSEEQGRLASMVHDVGAASLAEVLDRLASRHPSPDEYLGSFGRVWDACKSASDAHQLVTWPDFPIRYVPIPVATRMAAPSLYYLFYRSPAPLDPPGTHEYVVTPIDGLDADAAERHLRAWNDSVIKLNHVVHHGALGHHVQNWYAYRAPSRIGRIAAADCASRIAMLLGGTMAEGWACYATDLMDEVGFLTPDERVAEQQTRVRMLARAIVDIEFHTGLRCFDEAVRFYADEVGMPPAAARAEAVKNSMFPGTAMMYWLGTHGVHALRAAVARREGSAFTLQGFHERFLSHGAIPVAVTRRLMLGEEG